MKRREAKGRKKEKKKKKKKKKEEKKNALRQTPAPADALSMQNTPYPYFYESLPSF
jgi:hypothetical protein